MQITRKKIGELLMKQKWIKNLYSIMFIFFLFTVSLEAQEGFGDPEPPKNGKAQRIGKKALESGNKDYFAKVSVEELTEMDGYTLVYSYCIVKNKDNVKISIKRNCLIALSGGSFSNPSADARDFLYGVLGNTLSMLNIKVVFNQEFMNQANSILELAGKQVESEEEAKKSLGFLKIRLKHLVETRSFVKAIQAGDKNYFSKINLEEYQAANPTLDQYFGYDGTGSADEIAYDIIIKDFGKYLDALSGVFSNPDPKLRGIFYEDIISWLTSHSVSKKPIYKKNMESFIATATSTTDSENAEVYSNMIKKMRETLETMKHKKK